MKINSKILPQLDQYSKAFVNEGRYFLYKISHAEAEYALKADNKIYLLGENGEIIGEEKSLENLTLNELVYFDDLEMPPTTI